MIPHATSSRGFPPQEVGNVALYAKYLAHMGPVHIGVEGGRRPYLLNFDPTVPLIEGAVRRGKVLEAEGFESLQEMGLMF